MCIASSLFTTPPLFSFFEETRSSGFLPSVTTYKSFSLFEDLKTLNRQASVQMRASLLPQQLDPGAALANDLKCFCLPGCTDSAVC